MINQDCKNRAKYYLKKMKGTLGAYTEGVGYSFIRKNVAKFISERDNFPSDWNHVILTEGGSEGVAMCLELLIAN